MSNGKYELKDLPINVWSGFSVVGSTVVQKIPGVCSALSISGPTKDMDAVAEQIAIEAHGEFRTIQMHSYSTPPSNVKHWKIIGTYPSAHSSKIITIALCYLEEVRNHVNRI